MFTGTPNGIYSGTITATPNGCGLTSADAITRTWSQSQSDQLFSFTPTSPGTLTITLTNSNGLTNQAALDYTVVAAQMIDSAWLIDNAAVFGGDPATGPWVFGRAFSANGHTYTLPPPLNGLYPYSLGQDISADGIGFVSANAVQLDLNGKTLTYSNAAPISGLNGEFESDADGATPAGWDLSGCHEAVPYVSTTALHNFPGSIPKFNYLFGNNVLEWGTQKLPASLTPTMDLDGSGNIVLNFSGTAPAVGRQICVMGYAVTNVAGSTYETQYHSGNIYFVATNPTSSQATISTTPTGPPLQAATVTDSIGSAGLAQVIRTTSSFPISLPNHLYSARLAQGSPDGAFAVGGSAQSGNASVICIVRVYDATTGALIQPIINVNDQTNLWSVRDPRTSAGSRPFCWTFNWFPTTTAPVLVEVAVANVGGSPISLWLDGIRVTTLGDAGILATPTFGPNLICWHNLPAGIQAVYTGAKSLSVIDSVGGGGILQGQAKSAYSNAIWFPQQGNGNTGSIVGQAGNPILLTATGDDTGHLLMTSNSIATNAHRTVTNVTCTFGPDVDVANRQSPNPAVVLINIWGNIAVSNLTITNLPQVGIYLVTLPPDKSNAYTATFANVRMTCYAKVSNSYAWSAYYSNNVTVDDMTITGQGYAGSLYPGTGTADLTNGNMNSVYRNVVADCTAMPEREYAYVIDHRTWKHKNVSAPFGCFRNIHYIDCDFTSRCLGGMANGTGAMDMDVRNHNNVGGNGNVDFTNCTFTGITDGVKRPGASVTPNCSALFVDQLDGGNFHVFKDCTLTSTDNGVALYAPDGNGAQGMALIRCTFVYSNPYSYTPSYPYTLVSFRNSLYASMCQDNWMIDPVIDPSVPANNGIYWAGPGTNFVGVAWGIELDTPGVNYQSKPTVTGPTPPGGTFSVVQMVDDGQGHPSGAVGTITSIGFGASPSGYLHSPPIPLTFTGGTPDTPATGHVVLTGTEWAYRYLYYGNALTLTITQADGVTPIQGASVTLVDNASNPVFPAVPGSLNCDGTTLVSGLTDADGHVGLTDNAKIIPLPTVKVQQGRPTDSQAVQDSQLIAGITSIDGGHQVLTQGSVSTVTYPSFTLTVSAPGHVTYTGTITPTGSPISLTIPLS